MIRVYFWIFSVLFSFYTFQIFSQSPDSVSLEIKSSKNVYLESEPVWVEVNVNIPDEMKLDRAPVVFPSCDLKFVLTNNINDTLNDLGIKVTSVELKEYKKHYYDIFNLLDYYGTKENFTGSSSGGYFKLDPDNYNLVAILILKFNNSINYYYSAVIHFNVEKPEGIDQEAQKKLFYIEQCCSNYKLNLKDKLDQIYTGIIEFKNSFQNSVYTDKVEKQIVTSYGLNNDFKDSIQSYLINKIIERPDNNFNYSYMKFLEYFYEDNNIIEYMTKLSEIRESSDSAVLRKLIDNFLEDLRFRKSIK